MWIDHFFFSPATDAMFKSQALEYAQQAGFDLEWVQDSTERHAAPGERGPGEQELPDVLYSDVSSYVKVRRAGQALEVRRGGGAQQEHGRLHAGILAAVTSEGKQYAVPYAISTEEWYVRSDILGQARGQVSLRGTMLLRWPGNEQSADDLGSRHAVGKQLRH